MWRLITFGLTSLCMMMMSYSHKLTDSHMGQIPNCMPSSYTASYVASWSAAWYIIYLIYLNVIINKADI